MDRILCKSKLRHLVAMTKCSKAKRALYVTKLIQAIHDGKDIDAKYATVQLLRLEECCQGIVDIG